MSSTSQKIRDRSTRRFLDALERLQNGRGRHPEHAGKTVRLSIASVAREARMGRTTLHRYPELCASIKQLAATSAVPRAKKVNRVDGGRSLTTALRDLRAQNKDLVKKLQLALEKSLALEIELDRLRAKRPNEPVPLRPRRA